MKKIKVVPGSTRDILTQLVKGRDPSTGEQLPEDSVFHRADVIRALLEADEALAQVGLRAYRRARLPQRLGESWNEDEDKKLVGRSKAGATIEELAAEHRRSPRAIVLRLQMLGEIPADQAGTDPWLTDTARRAVRPKRKRGRPPSNSSIRPLGARANGSSKKAPRREH